MIWPRRPGWGRRGGVMGSAPGREAGQRRVGGQIHGQQRLEVFDGASLGEISEDPAQVMIGLEAAGLGGLDQAIKIGGGLGAGHGVMEEPVAAIMESFPKSPLSTVRNYGRLSSIESATDTGVDAVSRSFPGKIGIGSRVVGIFADP